MGYTHGFQHLRSAGRVIAAQVQEARDDVRRQHRFERLPFNCRQNMPTRRAGLAVLKIVVMATDVAGLLSISLDLHFLSGSIHRKDLNFNLQAVVKTALKYV